MNLQNINACKQYAEGRALYRSACYAIDLPSQLTKESAKEGIKQIKGAVGLYPNVAKDINQFENSLKLSSRIKRFCKNLLK
jgi:hypothetical protein